MQRLDIKGEFFSACGSLLGVQQSKFNCKMCRTKGEEIRRKKIIIEMRSI